MTSPTIIVKWILLVYFSVRGAFKFILIPGKITTLPPYTHPLIMRYTITQLERFQHFYFP